MKKRFYFFLLVLAFLHTIVIRAQYTVYQDEASIPYSSGFNGVKNKDGGPLSVRINNIWHYNPSASTERANSVVEEFIVETLNDDFAEAWADLSFRLARVGESPNLNLYLDLYEDGNVYSVYATLFLFGRSGCLRFFASDKEGSDALDGIVVKLFDYLLCGWGTVTVKCNSSPIIPDAYTLVEHRRMDNFIWDSCRLGLTEIKMVNPSDVDEARRICKSENFLNVNVLDFLLQHQDLIPEAWKTNSVCFWGTVVSIGGEVNSTLRKTCYVPYLAWWHGKWVKNWIMAHGASHAVVLN